MISISAQSSEEIYLEEFQEILDPLIETKYKSPLQYMCPYSMNVHIYECKSLSFPKVTGHYCFNKKTRRRKFEGVPSKSTLCPWSACLD